MKKIWVHVMAAAILITADGQGATALTQFGITWTFNGNYTTGQYANGDYWVVGPVNIISITNNLHTNGISPGVGNDGCMINPGVTTKQGYDNQYSVNYQAALNQSRPGGSPVSSTNALVLPVNSSLISSVSWLMGEPGCPLNQPTDTYPTPTVRSMAILTCVSNAPSAGSFRPAYCGSDKSARFNKSQLDYSKLANLTPATNAPALTNVEARFAGPWVDHVNGWTARYTHPSMHMQDYGRDLSVDIGEAALMLQLDFTRLPGSPSKETLLVRFVQLGIDLAGIADAGGGWPNDGGHGMGRKWPILFAGNVLNDAHMKNVGVWTNDFQEDMDTFYVAQTNVDITHSAGWSPDSRNVANGTALPYETANIGLPEWGIRHATDPYKDNLHWTAYYRVINNQSYVGWVLAAHIMGLRTAWNHAALFDYIDRCTSVVDPYNNSTTIFGGNFERSMWSAYRGNYSPRWVPNNPADLYGQGQAVNDADGDGMPESWETVYFGSPANANPAMLAANGVNTVYESYIAGLNPTNARSVLTISFNQSTSSQVAFQWQAVSGRVYSVYWTTNLLNSFQPLETNILWPQNSWTDLVHEAQCDGYYRIKAQLQP